MRVSNSIHKIKKDTIIIELEHEALLFIAEELPQKDSFTKEIWKWVHNIEEKYGNIY